METQFRYPYCVKLKQFFSDYHYEYYTKTQRNYYHKSRTINMRYWCQMTCKGDWSNDGGIFWFEKSSDVIMFKMVFAGTQN